MIVQKVRHQKEEWHQESKGENENSDLSIVRHVRGRSGMTTRGWWRYRVQLDEVRELEEKRLN